MYAILPQDIHWVRAIGTLSGNTLHFVEDMTGLEHTFEKEDCTLEPFPHKLVFYCASNILLADYICEEETFGERARAIPGIAEALGFDFVTFTEKVPTGNLHSVIIKHKGEEDYVWRRQPTYDALLRTEPKGVFFESTRLIASHLNTKLLSIGKQYYSQFGESCDTSTGKATIYFDKSGALHVLRKLPDAAKVCTVQEAALIWLHTTNPLSFLEETTLPSYFRKHNSDIHKEQRGYNSYVKSKLMDKFRKGDTILDLAGGKGQDLFRAAHKGFAHYALYDLDIEALEIAISKKFQLADSRKWPNTLRSIHIDRLDFDQDYANNVSKAKLRGSSFAMCNFAIHYFAKDACAMYNFALFVRDMLEVGGVFVYTAFDGAAVRNKIRRKDFVVRKNGQIKYSIKAKYDRSAPFADFGQRISVVLPFSANTAYEECLVNADSVEKVFAQAGFKRIAFESFDTLFSEYPKRQFAKLNRQDKAYLSLYHYTCYQKTDVTQGIRRWRYNSYRQCQRNYEDATDVV